DRLVAGGDEIGESDLALVVGERNGHGAALRNHGKRPSSDVHHVFRRPDRSAVVDIDEAEVVGAANCNAVSFGDLLDTALKCDTVFVAVSIPVGIHKYCGNTV